MSKSKSRSKSKSKTSRSKSPRNYCTVLDELYKLDKKVYEKFGELCLTSLLARTDPKGKRTLILPSKGLSKTKASLTEQLRSHIIRGNLTPEVLSKKGSMTVRSITGISYKIEVSGKTMKINDEKMTHKASGRNGCIYTVPNPLKGVKTGGGSDTESDEDEEEIEMKMYGGSTNFMYDLNSEPPSELRFMVLEDYAKKFPLDQHPLSSDYSYAHMLASHLLLQANQQIPNFGDTYKPFISSDPLATIELLLQLRENPLDSSKTLLDDIFLKTFRNSNYYLNDDISLVGDAKNLLGNMCLDTSTPGSCPFDTHYYMNTFVDTERTNLFNSSNLREGIVASYEKLAGEPNRYNPETVAIFNRVYGPKYSDNLLKNDLLRFGVKNLHTLPFEDYNVNMNTLFRHNAPDVVNNLLHTELLPDDFFQGFTRSDQFLNNFQVDMHSHQYLNPIMYKQSFNNDGVNYGMELNVNDNDGVNYGMEFSYNDGNVLSTHTLNDLFNY